MDVTEEKNGVNEESVHAELLDLSQRGGPKRSGTFERATSLRQLLRESGRPDSAEALLAAIDRALLLIQEPDLQEVGRASLRRPPYGEELLEDRLEACARVLASRLTAARRLAFRDGDIAPVGYKTMQRRRAQMVSVLAPLLRQELQRPVVQSDGGGGSEPRPIPSDASDFVGDVSIPDGTPVRPGEHFEKSWELRNAGTVPWVSRYLSRVGASEGYNLAETLPRVPIPDTQPGQNVVISVPVRAPRSAATCIVHWKMTDESGRLYFPDRYWLGVYFLIVVPGPH